MRNAHRHVVKMLFGAGTRRYGGPAGLKLFSTYQERLLSGVLKRKRLRLISKAIF